MTYWTCARCGKEIHPLGHRCWDPAATVPTPSGACGFMGCDLPAGHQGKHQAWMRVEFGESYSTTIATVKK